VDKRIDVLATALRLGGTVYDLEKLELCYAPPYSSAKDPVNMLGFTAANILRGDVKNFQYDEADLLDESKVTLLDVRTPEEYGMGKIGGALNIPVDHLRERMNELPKDKPVYLYCQVGLRGYIAARILSQNGYDVYNLSGGYKTYSTAKEEQQKQSPGKAHQPGWDPEPVADPGAYPSDPVFPLHPAQSWTRIVVVHPLTPLPQILSLDPGSMVSRGMNKRSCKIGQAIRTSASF
jgi:rhodanese-related sulfurtransferase